MDTDCLENALLRMKNCGNFENFLDIQSPGVYNGASTGLEPIHQSWRLALANHSRLRGRLRQQMTPSFS